jgi:hypothetical protein
MDSLVANLPQVNHGKARDRAAMMGVGGQYNCNNFLLRLVTRAKAIKKEDPKAFKQIMAGKVTIQNS